MAATPQSSGGLVLEPLRALRYDPAIVGDLGAVTAPPYDVVDADGVATLESLHPRNVVRLTLPHDDRGAGRYAAAADLLRAWLADGTLRRDARPSLWVAEQVVAGVRQRGLLGALALRDPEAGIVLPHENVMPGPVADRLELLRATRTDLEPVLLVHEAAPDVALLLELVCSRTPDIDVTTPDGARQRLWRVEDRAEIDRVARGLRDRRAVIADGHHRYTAALRLAAERRARDADATNASGTTLALLLDAVANPPRIDGIARAVAGLRYADAVAAVRAAGVDVAEVPVDELDRRVTTLGQTCLGLTDTRSAVVAYGLERLQARLPGSTPESWRGLACAVLHSVVLPVLWNVAEESRITYHHDATTFTTAVLRGAGTGVVVPPVDFDLVLSVAAAGNRMPRKSTSFAPKPRSGFLLHSLDETATGPNGVSTH